jgi:outer membrane lipoprotein carrier protein
MRLLWIGLLSVSTLFATPIVLPENFQADFIQKITNAKKKSITYSGKVRFSDRNLLKWEYLKPTKKEVCTDGFELLVVDHDLEQVSFYLINKAFNLPAILKKAKPFKDKKTVFIAKYEGREYTLQIDRKGRLSRVAYYDDLENTVLIIFDKMKYGKGKLKPESMKCNYPENYDVIRG